MHPATCLQGQAGSLPRLGTAGGSRSHLKAAASTREVSFHRDVGRYGQTAHSSRKDRNLDLNAQASKFLILTSFLKFKHLSAGQMSREITVV